MDRMIIYEPSDQNPAETLIRSAFLVAIVTTHEEHRKIESRTIGWRKSRHESAAG